MDFQSEVIQRSNHIPVLVDFWAEWCGPCRILTPVLDKLNDEDERWELVKLNTEEEPDIAGAYNVMSIPNVKLFSNGTVIGEFVGALPESQVRQWLDKNLPTEEKTVWLEVKSRETAWPDLVYAREIQEFLEKHPDFNEAYLDLARHMILQKPDEAVDILNSRPLMTISPETVEDLKTISELLKLDKEYDSITGGERMHSAATSLRESDMEGAIKTIIDAVMTNKKFANNLPQRASIAMFRLLGSDHPLTRRYRKLFEMALY